MFVLYQDREDGREEFGGGEVLLWNHIEHQPAAETVEHLRLSLLIVVGRIQHHRLSQHHHQQQQCIAPLG